MTLQLTLPRYPFTHFFQAKKNLETPILVYFRGGTDYEDGTLYEVSQALSQYLPEEHKKVSNSYFLLGNTLVTHWKPFNEVDLEQTLPLLGHAAWITFMSLVHFGEPTDSYRPPLVVGWRPKFGVNAQISGGIENVNCFSNRPLLKAYHVVFKKQKGSLTERMLPMLQTMKTIQRTWFDESGDEKPDWVTTAILSGNFKYDKKRHTTTATWLVYPQHAEKLRAAIHKEREDVIVDLMADMKEY